MKRHLILNLEAPLMSFGGETIDNLGIIRPFPATSMLTGLLANALGWRRVERERHQKLQDRLVFAARIDREPLGGLGIQDFQTAQLGASDKGWTTRGMPEERAGGSNTYNAPHLRFRDYHVDTKVTVALRLDPCEADPKLDELAGALEEPARPLFIGRKACLPSAPLFVDFQEAKSALEAILSWPLADKTLESPRPARMLWPRGEDAADMVDVRVSREYMLTDQRNWVSGLHGGGRWVMEGTRERDKFPLSSQTEAQKGGTPE